MASNRHLGRIVALQTLYEYDFRLYCEEKDVDLEGITLRNIGRYHDTLDDKPFVTNLVEGVSAASSDLDGKIAPLAPDWPVDQIARIDKIILRIALWELEKSKDVPPKVVINEAVELAKAFGGDASSRFINGVLGTAYRNMTGETKEESMKSSKDKKTEPKKTASKKVEPKKAESKKAESKKTEIKKTTTKAKKPSTKKKTEDK